MEEMFDRIKEHAYKAKDGAVKLTKTVIGKTNNVVSQTKVKFAISETEDKIKEIYGEPHMSVIKKAEIAVTEWLKSAVRLTLLWKNLQNLKSNSQS